MDKVIILFGILTYSLALTTAFTGWRGFPVKYHRRLALTVISLATVHAILVLINFIIGG